jgi:hypothetical protein
VRLEGQPDEHPLKSRIATFALTAVTHFARIIGQPADRNSGASFGSYTSIPSTGFRIRL